MVDRVRWAHLPFWYRPHVRPRGIDIGEPLPDQDEDHDKPKTGQLGRVSILAWDGVPRPLSVDLPMWERTRITP